MDAREIVQHALGLAAQGRLEEARGVLEAAAAREPGSVALVHALGQVKWHGGEHASALEHLARAAGMSPGDPVVRTDHARALWSLGRLGEAIAEFNEVVRLDPMQLGSYMSLAQVYLQADRFGEAWGLLGVVARAFPGWPEPYRKWAELAIKAGDADRAIEVARRGLKACPGDRVLLAQLVGYMNFADGVDPAEHVGLFRRLGAACAASAPVAAPEFTNTREPGRPLRVGFLSPDFRFHACAFFLAGLIGRLDRAKVTPIAYSFGVPDAVTENFSRLSEQRELSGADLAGVRAAVLGDRIDVAVDCAGWSTGSRVEGMQPRLAPVQVTYLGWPHTTGLPDMDWRIVDGVTDPAGAEAWASEGLLRVPGCFLCFAIPEHAPEPAMSPGLSGYAAGGDAPRAITFASFNRLEKAQGACLSAWAAVLDRCPGGRLLVKSAAFPGAQPNFLRRFKAAGGDPARVDWAGWESDPARHLSAFHRADIVLDTFPYNGTTTTCEALLMGVPVVGLRGGQHRSRVGASLLEAVGLGGLAADDEEGYVRLAVSLANDPGRLVELHRTVRGRFLASGVCDAGGFAVKFEAALRSAWAHWCRGGGA